MSKRNKPRRTKRTFKTGASILTQRDVRRRVHPHNGVAEIAPVFCPTKEAGSHLTGEEAGLVKGLTQVFNIELAPQQKRLVLKLCVKCKGVDACPFFTFHLEIPNENHDVSNPYFVLKVQRGINHILRTFRQNDRYQGWLFVNLKVGDITTRYEKNDWLGMVKKSIRQAEEDQYIQSRKGCFGCC